MYHQHLEALMPEVPVYIENAMIAEETNSDSVSSALLSCASLFYQRCSFLLQQLTSKVEVREINGVVFSNISIEYSIFQIGKILL